MNTKAEDELAQALFRTLYDAGVAFNSADLIPRLTATVRALGFSRVVPVSDEAEWEYAVRDAKDRIWFKATAGVRPGDVAVRRRKAGPWLPVDAAYREEQQ